MRNISAKMVPRILTHDRNNVGFTFHLIFYTMQIRLIGLLPVNLLTVAYGEYAMNKSSVSEWHRRFKEGQEDVEDNPRSGQPKTQRRDADVDRL